ncbi:MAG TPA: hypothetical protein VLF71_01590 [Candidatus Saccharimonadales bacterium]|nr:hypothetical protein [Candidatus Saccharimonadales bacterium]
MVRGESSWTVRAVGLTLTTSLGFAGLAADGRPNPEGYYLDCQRQPRASIVVPVDALHPTVIDMGDMRTSADGTPLGWREDITVDTLDGAGEIAVTVDGFGPILRYNDLAAGGLWSAMQMTDDNTGDMLRVSMPAPSASDGSRALVNFIFTCGPS